MQKIEDLVERYPHNDAILETAASIYLDQNEIKKTRASIEQLKQMTGPTPKVMEMESSLLIQERRWDEAFVVIEKLHARNPEDPQTTVNYAYVAMKARKWTEAIKTYKELIERGEENQDWRSSYRLAQEQGAPSLGGSFSYFIRPQKQRDYIFKEQGRFWLKDWLQLTALVSEEFYQQDSESGAEALEEWVDTHSLEGKVFLNEALSMSTRWDTFYSQGLVLHGGALAAEYEIEKVDVYSSYRFNQLVREPIAAISKEGRMDQVKLGTRVNFLERWQAGQETTIQWYHVDDGANTLNGEEDLGHKLIYDLYTQYRIFKKPYLVVNYHFKRGHWDKKFNGAESVIDFLSDEQVHSPGFYFEHNLNRHLTWHMGGSYGLDTKRNIDYVFWSLGHDLWITDDVKFSVSYDVAQGDSGVSGSGDTQAINGAMNIYF